MNPTDGRASRHRFLWAGLIVLLTLAAFAPTLRGGFIWDDDVHVTNNPALRSPHGLARIWLEPGAVPQYYPLLHTLFWIEYHLWRLNPFGYHLVNVLLQALNGVLLWRVLARLKVPGAWIAAAIFAVHPMQVESVAWITEGKNLLSGAFYLSALLAYGRFSPWEAAPGPPNNPRRFYWLALALYLCALLSKTVACSLPAAILLLIWWKRGCVRRRDVLPLLPFFAAGAALGLTTAWIEKYHVGARGPEWSLTLADRMLIAGRALWFYAAKLVWPRDLMFIYPRWRIDAGDWHQWLFPAAAIAVIATLWTVRARAGRGPLVAVLFFAGTLAPALGFVDLYPMRYSFVADHFQYLAGIGLMALVAAGITTALRSPVRRGGITVALILFLGVLSWRHCGAFSSSETLWRDTLAKNPNGWMARDNLGLLLLDQGNIDEAIAQQVEALRINPGDAVTHDNLGTALVRAGRIQEAIEQYQQALQINPNAAATHDNLGHALARAGRIPEAISQYQQALQLNPDDAATRNNLGHALAQTGQLPEAIAQYQQALQINPDDAVTHNNLGNTLARANRLPEAISQFEQALQIKPDFAEAHYNLGNALAQTGGIQEAITQYEEAVRLRPNFAEAREQLARLRVAP